LQAEPVAEEKFDFFSLLHVRNSKERVLGARFCFLAMLRRWILARLTASADDALLPGHAGEKQPQQ